MVASLREAKNQALVVGSVINSPVDRELFYGHVIAKPNQNYFIFDGNITIAGWIVSKKKVNSVNIYLDGELIDNALLNVHRPGVTKKYQQLAEQYGGEFGFKQIVKLPTSDSQQLILAACFKDGSQQEIGKIELKAIDLEQERKPQTIIPDFIVIGTMKGATSAIYDYICRHSRVLQRKPKEIHFFSKSQVYEQGWNWYLSQFAIKQNAPSNQKTLVGEASPSYISDLDAPSKIIQAFPKVKVIASLRNPTDRAISHYYHQVKRVQDETRSITEAFSQLELTKSTEAMKLYGDDELALRREGNWETTRYLCNGLYAPQIKNWLSIFPPEQILILDYHQLETEPNQFIEKLFTFLNLQDELITDVQKVYANQYSDAPQEVVQGLNAYFAPYNQQLKEILPNTFSWL